MAQLATQLAVFMKNIPGTLSEVLNVFSEDNINIEGLMINDAVDHAVVRMVVNYPNRAIHLLGDRGLLVVESDIVAHEMPDVPGELMALTKKLAKTHINISYLYGSTPLRDGKSRIFLQTSDNKKVLRILKGSRSSGKKAPAGKKKARRR
jgi:hypothetical protein